MGKPTCTFCGATPDGIVNDVACCRRCAHTNVAKLVARAFVGPNPDPDKTVLYQSLLTTFGEAYWAEIAALIAERAANKESQSKIGGEPCSVTR